MVKTLWIQEWSVESLPSNPVTRVQSPAGSGILIPILGLGVCPLSVFCPLLSPAAALTLCWPHILGGPLLCICLVFCSRICCSSYRHLTHGHLCCMFRGGGISPTLGNVSNSERKKKETRIWNAWKCIHCHCCQLGDSLQLVTVFKQTVWPKSLSWSSLFCPNRSYLCCRQVDNK